jgi:hypothetical protein
VFTNPANAGWVTIKNDTNKTIVLQDTITVDGTTKRGTPIRLLPGETVREFRATPGVKTVVVCECGKPGVALYRGELKCPEENQSFSICIEGKNTTVKPTPPTTTAVVAKK